MSGADAFPLFVVVLLSGIALVIVRTRYVAWEFQLVALSWLLHVLSAFAQLWLIREVYGGIGDMMTYHRFGQVLSGALHTDFVSVAFGLLQMMFIEQDVVGIYLPGDAETANMYILSGFAHFFLGNSVYAVNVAFASVGWFGKLTLYQAFRSVFEERMRLALLSTSMLLPSAVFWSAGVIKEAVAITGLGLAVWSISGWIVHHRLEVLPGALGILLIGLVKPYILVALLPASAVWAYWQRAAKAGGVTIRPLSLVLAVMAGMAGVIAIGQAFPEYSIESFADEVTAMQLVGTRVPGGSSFTLGDPTVHSIWGQLAFAPMALFTALFRPTILEATNPQILVNALETTAMLFASGYVLWRRSPKGAWRIINREPMLVFCVVFIGIMALAVGLTSSNLGTLSRYRMPIYPLFAATLGVLVLSVRGDQRGWRTSRAARAQPGARGSARTATGYFGPADAPPPSEPFES